MTTGLKGIDRSRNRDRFKYNWRRAQILTHPLYISKREEKVEMKKAKTVASKKNKAEKPLRDKEKIEQKEAKKMKKAEDKVKQAKEKAETKGVT